RELVAKTIFGYVNQLHLRLLQAFPLTASISITGAARRGAPREEIQELLTSLVSTELRGLMDHMEQGLRACEVRGDRIPDLSERKRPRENAAERAGVAKALNLVRRQLAEKAAPKVVDFTLKEIARAACGDTWNETRFTEVMATRPDLETEAARAIANILTAHV